MTQQPHFCGSLFSQSGQECDEAAWWQEKKNTWNAVSSLPFWHFTCVVLRGGLYEGRAQVVHASGPRCMHFSQFCLLCSVTHSTRRDRDKSACRWSHLLSAGMNGSGRWGSLCVRGDLSDSLPAPPERGHVQCGHQLRPQWSFGNTNHITPLPAWNPPRAPTELRTKRPHSFTWPRGSPCLAQLHLQPHRICSSLASPLFLGCALWSVLPQGRCTSWALTLQRLPLLSLRQTDSPWPAHRWDIPPRCLPPSLSALPPSYPLHVYYLPPRAGVSSLRQGPCLIYCFMSCVCTQ